MNDPEQIAAFCDALGAYYDTRAAWSFACDKPRGERTMIDSRRIAELEEAMNEATHQLWRACRADMRGERA